MTGRIELIIGPMFAGKTTELLRRANRFKHTTKSCILIKSAKDTRYDVKKITTHDNTSSQALTCANLKNVFEELIKYDIICIDEGQFYEDLYETVLLLAEIHNKTVIVSGLDGTYTREPFEQICNLVPLSEKVTKLTAICKNDPCDNEASFTFRKDRKEHVVEVVGGHEMYMPLCRSCYKRLSE